MYAKEDCTSGEPARAPNPANLSYLTGLRGWSALFVFLAHTGCGGPGNISGGFNTSVNLGKYGVAMFFVLSGFTLAHSISSSARPFEFKAYMLRRIFRICL